MCNMQVLKNTRDDSVVLCKSVLTGPSLRAPQCKWTSVGVEVVSIHLWVLCFSQALSLLNKTELESTTVSLPVGRSFRIWKCIRSLFRCTISSWLPKKKKMTVLFCFPSLIMAAFLSLKGIIYAAFKHPQAVAMKRLYLFLVERCNAVQSWCHGNCKIVWSFKQGRWSLDLLP